MRVGRHDRPREPNLLVLRRLHGRDDLVLREGEPRDALEALLEVGLHTEGVLRLGQDFQQLVVGQEEEAGEEQALLFQIVVQAFLDVVKHALWRGWRGDC